jgi:hypothetical protein
MGLWLGQSTAISSRTGRPLISPARQAGPYPQRADAICRKMCKDRSPTDGSATVPCDCIVSPTVSRA